MGNVAVGRFVLLHGHSGVATHNSATMKWYFIRDCHCHAFMIALNGGEWIPAARM